MECLAAVVCTFEVAPGVTVAAVWDGGRWCDLHAVDGGQYGPVVERWSMWDEWADGPQIPCTPEHLRALVQWRLSDQAVAMDLATWARSFTDTPVASQTTRQHAPQFSAN